MKSEVQGEKKSIGRSGIRFFFATFDPGLMFGSDTYGLVADPDIGKSHFLAGAPHETVESLWAADQFE